MILARAHGREIRTRGSVALEGALVLFPLALALVLNLELLVRARRHAVMAWATCGFVRARVLGDSWRDAEAQARDRMNLALGSATQPLWEESRTSTGLSLRGHWRYAALWQQSGGALSKHHFEVNELCRFPF